MPILTSRQQLRLGLFLAALMLLTRSQHFAGLHHLPEATWAVFFLAGFYLRALWPFPALCGLAALSDWAAIAWGGSSAFCVTPAYAMLLPAYGALWLAGRWYVHMHRDTMRSLMPLAGAVLVSALAAELLSSGGFYFLGGRFAEPTLAGFLPRLGAYFPSMLGAMALYVGIAALVHAAWAAGRRVDPDGPRTVLPGMER
jgi:hypothetical protein